jgi:hypothetical protein
MKKITIWFCLASCLFYLLIMCSCSKTEESGHDYRIVKIEEMGNEDNVNEELFGDIHSVAVDQNGNLYVADRAFNSIKKFNQNGKFIRKWGSTGSGPEEFQWLQQIVVDSEGNVFAVDRGNCKLVKFNSDGVLLKSVQTGANTKKCRITPGNRLFVWTINGQQSTLQQFDNDLVLLGNSIVIENNFLVLSGYDYIIEPPFAIYLDNINGLISKYDLVSGKLIREYAFNNEEIAAERMRLLGGKVNSTKSGITYGRLSPFSKGRYTLSGAFYTKEGEQSKRTLYKKSYIYTLDGAYYGRILIESGDSPVWYIDIVKFNDYFYTFDQTKVTKYKLLKTDQD